MKNFLRYLPTGEMNDEQKKKLLSDSISAISMGGGQADQSAPIGQSSMFNSLQPELPGIANTGEGTPGLASSLGFGQGAEGSNGTGSEPVASTVFEPDNPMIAPPAPRDPRPTLGSFLSPFADGQMGTGSPIPYEAPPSASEQTMSEIDRLQHAPLKREHSVWKRLGSGLKQGLAAWAQSGGQGGLAGAVGSLATGGITGAASPKAMAEWKKENQIGKLWNRLGQEQGAEANFAGIESRKAQAADIRSRPEREMQAQQAKVQQAQKDFENSMAKIKAQQEFTSGKTELWTNPETGQVFKRFPNDPNRKDEPVLNDKGEPVADPSELSYETTSPITGQRVRVKGRDLLSNESMVKAADVGARNKTEENVYEYKSKRAEVDSNISESQTKIDQINSDIDRASQSIEAQKRLDYGGDARLIKSANEQIEKLRAELRNENAKLAGYQSLRGKLPKPPTVQGRSGGRIADREMVEAFAKQRGMTYAEAKKKAESEGWTVK